MNQVQINNHKGKIVFFAVIFLISFIPLTTAAISRPTKPSFGKKSIPGTVLIKYKSSVSESTRMATASPKLDGILKNKPHKRNSIFNRRDLKSVRAVGQPAFNDESRLDLWQKIDFDDKVADPEAFCAEVKKKAPDEILYCQPDHLMTAYSLPNDTYIDPDQNGNWSTGAWEQNYEDMWGLKNIHAIEAWNDPRCNNNCMGEGVLVAVVDTGLDYNHPDIWKNVWVNPNIISDVNGDGVIDLDDVDVNHNHQIDPEEIQNDMIGWNFAYGGADPMDDGGHGTHVAGTIAATANNGIGIAGVAPKAKILPLKGLGKDGGDSSTLAQAIMYAADMGARVINNSWGCSYPCPSNPVVEEAVRYAHQKDVVLVFAAGNSGYNVAYYSPQNMSEVITVASVDHLDKSSDFSNWGDKIDISAPGGESGPGCSEFAQQNILSLLAAGTDMYADCSEFSPIDWTGKMVVNSSYYLSRGTSMAAPHVSGLVALFNSWQPGIHNDMVKLKMRYFSDDLGALGKDLLFGYGRINVSKSLFHKIDGLKISIDSPMENSFVKGLIEIRGNAWIDSTTETFDHYRLHYSTQGTGGYITSYNTNSVQDNILGNWNTANYPDGKYELLLEMITSGLYVYDAINVIVDNQNDPPTITTPNFILLGLDRLNEVRIEATDPDDPTTPAGQLTFSANIPQELTNAGAQFNIENQIFSWTPSEALKGPHQVIFTVRDTSNMTTKTITFDAQPPSSDSYQYPLEVYDEGKFTGSKTELNANWNFYYPVWPIVIEDITEYRYRILKDSVNGIPIRDWTSTGKPISGGMPTSTTATGLSLENGSTYYFEVIGKNSEYPWWSPPSFSDGITVNTDLPPAPIVDDGGDVTEYPFLGAALKTHPSTFQSQYQILKNSTAGPVILDWTDANGCNGCFITTDHLDLENYETYFFAVKVRNAAGWSTVGYSNGVMELNFTFPKAPIVSDEGDTTDKLDQLYASWTYDARVIESQYRILKDSISGTVIQDWTTTGRGDMFVTAVNLSLLPGNQYFFAVKSRNSAGWGSAGYSNGIRINSSVPNAPTITDFSGDMEGFMAAWNPVASAIEYQYQIRQISSTGPIIRDWTSNGINTSMTAMPLTVINGATYYFLLKARNETGWSEIGYRGLELKVHAQTPVVTDEGQFTNRTDQLSASWQYDPAVLGYRYAIYENATTGLPIKDWAVIGSTNSITSKGLSLVNGNTYYIAVSARDAYGWGTSSASDGIRVDTTPPTRPQITITTPGVMVNGVFVVNQNKTIAAAWTIARDNESGIKEYLYGIGGTNGQQNIVPWTSVGMNTSMTKTGLNLQHGMTYYVWVKAVNGAGLSTSSYSQGIKVDIVAPTGSIKINNPLGASYTNSRNITLYLTTLDDGKVYSGGQMKFSQDKGITWTQPESYAPTKALTLSSPGDGMKTVTIRFKDPAGNWSGFKDSAGNLLAPYTASILLDTIAPTGKMRINGDAPTTTNPVVTLSFQMTESGSGLGSGAQTMISNNNKVWTTYMGYASTKPWTLSAGYGMKTVYTKVKDGAGNSSAVMSDTIYLAPSDYTVNSTSQPAV